MFRIVDPISDKHEAVKSLSIYFNVKKVSNLSAWCIFEQMSGMFFILFRSDNVIMPFDI